jgi:hypothetical protein
MKKQEIFGLFQEAIRNLERFTLQNQSSTVPHVLDLDVKNRTIIAKSHSLLRKMLRLCRSLLERIFLFKRHSKQERKRLEIQQELLRSVVLVKKHYHLLDLLKAGTDDQRLLAQRAQQVIDSYNALISQSKTPSSLKGNLVKFFYDKLGASIDDELRNNRIDLPKIAFSQTFYDRSMSKKISALAVNIPIQKQLIPLTQYETDAFCMKALSMIRSNAIPVASIGEALSCVKANPIATAMMQSGEEESSASIVSLSQVLDIFPGEIIELYGAFKRNGDSSVMSVPISDSFRIASKSLQSGFPHPSQVHGWALTDKLIPTCPLRLDQLHLFHALDRRKREIAEELLPKGRLIGKAKALHRLKMQAFDQNRTQFIALHRQLFQAIFAAADRPWPSTLDNYFRLLSQQPSPYSQHTKAVQMINHSFIEQPFAKLEERWKAGIDEGLLTGLSKVKVTAVKEIMNQKVSEVMLDLATRADESSTPFERAMLDFVQQVGVILCDPALNLILQYQSEKFDYASPLLHDFDRCIQFSLYRQLQTFQQEFELEINSVAEMQHHLADLLKKDIALFEAEELPQENAFRIVSELESYFTRALVE